MAVSNSVFESGDGVSGGVVRHDDLGMCLISSGVVLRDLISKSKFSLVYGGRCGVDFAVPCVVKVAEGEENIARLSRELDLLKRNVVQGTADSCGLEFLVNDHLPFSSVDSVKRVNDVAYIVLSYHGVSLEKILKAEGALEWKRAVDVSLQVLDALTYLHTVEGVVHRDVKPENVLVNDGYVTLIDFNLVGDIHGDLLSSASERREGCVGTPLYSAPEQLGVPILGVVKSVDQRADVYAVGAVLYHMLAGFPRWGEADGLSVINTSVPKDLDAVVRVACAQHPDNRYASAEDMVVALKGILLADREYQDESAKKEEEATYSEWPAVSSYRKAGLCGPGGQSQEEMRERLIKIHEANRGSNDGLESLVLAKNLLSNVLKENQGSGCIGDVRERSEVLGSFAMVENEDYVPGVSTMVPAQKSVGVVPSSVLEQGYAVKNVVPSRYSSWPAAVLAGVAACAVVGGMYQMDVDVVLPGKPPVVESVSVGLSSKESVGFSRVLVRDQPDVVYTGGLPVDENPVVFDIYNPLGVRDDQKWWREELGLLYRKGGVEPCQVVPKKGSDRKIKYSKYDSNYDFRK